MQTVSTSTANRSVSKRGKMKTETPPMVEIPSSTKIHYINGRGNNMLIYQGHRYIQNNVYAGKKYWKCTKWHSQCKARAITDSADPERCILKNTHNHNVADVSHALRIFKWHYKQSQRSGKELLVINGITFFRNRQRNNKQYWKCNQYYKYATGANIFFTKSSRGRPAIVIGGMRYLFMSENEKRVVWRCSAMATDKLKCPARILQFKNPERFVIHREKQHIHAPLKRTKPRSQKGKLQLSYNGFYYCKEKTIHEKEYWRCIYYTTKIKCHGRLHVVGNQVFRGTSHNHVARRFKRADYKRLSNAWMVVKESCIQFTNTQRGRIMLNYAGYKYVQNRQSTKNIFWRCARYVKHGCRASYEFDQDTKLFKTTEAAIFGISQRGARKLIYRGFQYVKDRDFPDSTNWRCALFKRHKCRARAITKHVGGVICVRPSNFMHNHSIVCAKPFLESQDEVIVCYFMKDMDMCGKSKRAQYPTGSAHFIRNTSIYVPAVFGTTRRGHKKLLHDGHAYTRDRQSVKTCNWKCSLFTRYRCRARAVTKDIEGLIHMKVTNADHYHPKFEYKATSKKEAISKNKTAENGARVNWKCRFYQRLHCKARALTKNINGCQYVKMFNIKHTHGREVNSPRKRRKIKLEVAHFGSTQRGKPLLVIGGYSYIRNGEFIHSINWRCSLHRTLKCKAKAIMIKRDGQKCVRLSNPEHNHAPNMKFTDLKRTKSFGLLHVDGWQFTAGQRGKPKLVIGNNSFFRTKGDNQRSYWSCSSYKSKKCRCKLVTHRDSFVVKFTHKAHTHPDEYVDLSKVQMIEANMDDFYERCSIIEEKPIIEEIKFERISKQHFKDEIDDDYEGKYIFPHDLRMETGTKGRPKLVMGGYAFFRNNCARNKTYWLCSRNRTIKCKFMIKSRKLPYSFVKGQRGALKILFQEFTYFCSKHMSSLLWNSKQI
uniref:FLYWCH-type domain-containing protein n=1 Tax=Anopheles albimanus TaxID=7167 RepID=A0A182F8L4_ANOAL